MVREQITAIKITHIPSRLSASAVGPRHSSMRGLKEKCDRVLKVKLAAFNKGELPEEKTVRTYIISSEKDYPYHYCPDVKGVVIDNRIPDKVFDLLKVLDGEGEEFEEMMRDLEK